ncbi:MAG: four helix bundle protein [Patescibacteria group bacterium]
MELEDLEIYKLAREIGKDAWKIYNILNWQDKKIMGDQFIAAIDSIGANISEGFGRYHFLDKNKFNYNSRGSLLESVYWLNLLSEREKITKETANILQNKLSKLHLKLNNYINSTKQQVNRPK